MVQVHPGPPDFSWLRDPREPVERHGLAAAVMVGSAAEKFRVPADSGDEIR